MRNKLKNKKEKKYVKWIFKKAAEYFVPEYETKCIANCISKRGSPSAADTKIAI